MFPHREAEAQEMPDSAKGTGLVFFTSQRPSWDISRKIPVENNPILQSKISPRPVIFTYLKSDEKACRVKSWQRFQQVVLRQEYRLLPVFVEALLVG